METPDFTGLHGKKLIKTHLAWQMEARKAGASFEKVRYAGLSIEQATEMYQYGEKNKSVLFIQTVIPLIFFGIPVVTSLPDPEKSIYHTIGDMVLIVVLLASFIVGAVKLIRARNMETMRRAYIKATDERLASARHRSGIILLLWMAYLMLAVGSILFMKTPASSGAELTPLAGAGMALYIAAVAQSLAAIVSYLIMLRR